MILGVCLPDRISAKRAALALVAGALAAVLVALPATAHGISGTDAAFVTSSRGAQIVPFLYLGAKHMVTGYDHLLFLLGVIFFVYRLSHVALYVSVFSLGHSITLLSGVLSGVQIDPYLIDAIIGLSVVYKAFDNLGGFRTLFGVQPNNAAAVLVFGLFHGFGLATKIQDLKLSPDGLVANLVSFNVGVEIGQVIALSVMLAAIAWWRRGAGFARGSIAANALLLAGGFMLMEYQLAGFFAQSAGPQ